MAEVGRVRGSDQGAARLARMNRTALLKRACAERAAGLAAADPRFRAALDARVSQASKPEGEEGGSTL